MFYDNHIPQNDFVLLFLWICSLLYNIIGSHTNNQNIGINRETKSHIFTVKVPRNNMRPNMLLSFLKLKL